MTNQEFNLVVQDQVNRCHELLGVKNAEYTPDDSDRLDYFKKAAMLNNTTPEAALFGMLSKHILSIADMCTIPGRAYSMARWNEKITDGINYLLLLRALVEEENGQNTDQNS